MKNINIAFNRSYVKGLNSVQGTSLSALNGIRECLKDVSDKLSTNEVEAIAERIGQLERYHAPREIPARTNSDGWVGSACMRSGGTWEQWIQTAKVYKSSIPHDLETEIIQEQVIRSGSDRTRMHIEWNSGREEGYTHAATSRTMTSEEFMDTMSPPPSCLMALANCPGKDAMYGWTIQTGKLFDNVDNTFLWYDSTRTMKWYRFLVYSLGDETYVCVVNENHLEDALSGFDDHHVTICDNNSTTDDHDFCLLKGSIRIDGMFEGKHRTAVIMTARLEEDVIDSVMGAA